MGFKEFFQCTIGIELGSERLRIIENGSIILDEDSQQFFNTISNSNYESGDRFVLKGEDIAINFSDYLVSDFDLFEKYLRDAIKKALNTKSKIFTKSYIMYLSIPSGLNGIEKRFYRDSAEQSGAREVYLAYRNNCSAIGLNLLSEQNHFILVEIGFGRIEMTVYFNGVVETVSVVKMGTSDIYKLLKNYFSRKYDLRTTDTEIESLLIEMKASLDEIMIQFIKVEISEIYGLLNNIFTLVNEKLREALGQLDKHIDKGAVLNGGIYFTGTGSTLPLLRDLIIFEEGVKQTVSQNPKLDTINGLIIMMSDTNKYKSMFMP